MMVFTQKDIEKIYSGSFPGYTAKECDKLLDGITGVDGKFKYEVEPKVQAYIDLIAKGIDYVKDKEMCDTLMDNKRRYAWHRVFKQVAKNWPECQKALDKAGIKA